ncbi:hypothetical protein A0H81_09429 [Grifola frondosa]|uniref:Uncharacterized protein n=1 Tax=Grifola frondosa TaxID=5627 RepID=A0A1C7M2J4_GRIFR|nr:hypothetical protein A0H81_09429 [Grifola frondosa]
MVFFLVHWIQFDLRAVFVLTVTTVDDVEVKADSALVTTVDDVEVRFSLITSHAISHASRGIWVSYRRGLYPVDILRLRQRLRAEALLGLETIAFCEFVDGAQDGVMLDSSSTFTDLQCCTDALSVELWQPEAIKALSMFVAFVSNRPKRTNVPLPTPRLLDQLPFCLSASLSIGRFMFFVTSPNLAPDEELNISRGVAADFPYFCWKCCVIDHSCHTCTLPEQERAEWKHKAEEQESTEDAPDMDRIYRNQGNFSPRKWTTYEQPRMMMYWVTT